MADQNAWPPERVELLRRLYGDGLSASQIGAELGATRNAVIGKLHRLGLTGRVYVPAPRQKRETPLPDVIVSNIIVEGKPTMEEKTGCSLFELKDGVCRYPVGDPQAPDFYFCGEAAVTGFAYCAQHCRVCYCNVTEKRAESARDRERIVTRKAAA